MQTENMISAGENVLTCVSGGADSVLLLRALECLQESLGFTLFAVHVEHGIRADQSLRDADFVRLICAQSGIPCDIVSVDTPSYAKEHGLGLEEAARILRYSAFLEIAEKRGASRIAVAHQMEDNAETMLFHLARGTGLAGLAGIPPVRGKIIRPLLCVSREEIEGWLTERGEKWCTDETNTDTGYSRNRTRAKIIPELKELNSAAIPHMSEAAARLRRTIGFLDRTIAGYWEDCIQETEDGGLLLELAALEKLDPVLKEHLMYRVLQQAAGHVRDLTGTHVELLLSLCEKEAGKELILPYGLHAKKEYGQIRITSGDSSQSGTVWRARDLQIPGETVCGEGWIISTDILVFEGDTEKIPRKTYTKWIDYDKIKNSLQIRPRRTGDYLQIDQKGGHKTIQDYMVNEKIPAAVRENIPLIADGAHIVWVVGGRISEAYKVTSQTKRVLALCAAKNMFAEEKR